MAATLEKLGNIILKERVILYDGVCNVCNVGVRFIANRDPRKALHFCSVQSKAAEPYLKITGLTRKEVLERFVFIQNDHWSEGSTAALEITKHLKQPWPLLSYLSAVPLPLRDGVYDWVAMNRYKWFGRTEVCQVPATDILDRFIDAEELVQGKCSEEHMQEEEEMVERREGEEEHDDRDGKDRGQKHK